MKTGEVTDTKIPPCTLFVLKEMCKRVRAPFTKIDFNSEGWYTKYEWSEEEQEDFVNWLADYLYKNKEARKDIAAFFPYATTKKYFKKVAKWFVADYGWKLKAREKNG